MKTLIIIIIGIVLLALVVFTIIRNNIDRKKFEKQLTDDKPITMHDENDIEVGDGTIKTVYKFTCIR